MLIVSPSILGEIVNLQRFKLPKSQPKYKMSKKLWLAIMFIGLFWQADILVSSPFLKV
jgi:hypothetical protein